MPAEQGAGGGSEGGGCCCGAERGAPSAGWALPVGSARAEALALPARVGWGRLRSPRWGSGATLLSRAGARSSPSSACRPVDKKSAPEVCVAPLAVAVPGPLGDPGAAAQALGLIALDETPLLRQRLPRGARRPPAPRRGPGGRSGGARLRVEAGPAPVARAEKPAWGQDLNFVFKGGLAGSDTWSRPASPQAKGSDSPGGDRESPMLRGGGKTAAGGCSSRRGSEAASGVYPERPCSSRRMPGCAPRAQVACAPRTGRAGPAQPQPQPQPGERGPRSSAATGRWGLFPVSSRAGPAAALCRSAPAALALRAAGGPLS